MLKYIPKSSQVIRSQEYVKCIHVPFSYICYMLLHNVLFDVASIYAWACTSPMEVATLGMYVFTVYLFWPSRFGSTFSLHDDRICRLDATES